MLERALQLTFRDFSTWFLLVALVVVPIELVYSFAFRDVIAVRHIHGAIEAFDEGQDARGVGPGELRTARIARWGATALQLLLLPWLATVARGLLDQLVGGRVPSIRAALAERRARASVLGALTRAPATLIAAAGTSLLLGLLLFQLGNLVIEPVRGGAAWAGIGMVHGVARSVALPVLVIAWAEGMRSEEGEPRGAANLS